MSPAPDVPEPALIAESVARWEPEIERYWFCRHGGHVIVSTTQDVMNTCPCKDEWLDPCGYELFGPLILLPDVTDWVAEHFDGQAGG